MSTWLEKADCVETINYYKRVYKDDDKAYERASDVLNISVDKLIEITE